MFGTLTRMATQPQTIGQVAERLGLNPRTIRYYERIGLLPEPQRTEAGYRLYEEDDEERLRFIKRAQRVGLNLGEIKETLGFRDRGDRPCDYILGAIEQRLSEVDRSLRELRTFKRELSELRNRMRAGGTQDSAAPYCHYLDGD